MLLVPYIPKPLPDEILGSWLARIRFHNTKGTWNSMIKECGITRAKYKPFFDLVDYDECLEKLFTKLGTSYEQVLQELTTLPYLLTFVTNNYGNILPGTINTKAPLNVRGKKIDKISLLGLKRAHGQTISPSFCMRCLVEDQEQHGEAYWHRSHQLPNVFFCSIHECELHNWCPQCRKRVLAPLYDLMPLPRTTCDCGCRFDRVQLIGKPSQAHVEFAKLSASALETKAPSWTRSDVIAQLKQWFKEDFKQRHSTSLSLIQSAFAPIPDPLEPTNELSVSTSLLDAERKLAFRATPSCSSAPEFCAMLVAMGKSLPEATSAFRDKSREVSPPISRRNRRPAYFSSTKSSGSVKKSSFERERKQMERALSLSKALHETLLSTDIPTAITTEKLGKIANLSPEQASTAVASHDFLRNSITKLNSDLPTRKIKWAANKLFSMGQKLTKVAIFNTAGLDTRNETAKKLWNSVMVHNGKLEFKLLETEVASVAPEP